MASSTRNEDNETQPLLPRNQAEERPTPVYKVVFGILLVIFAGCSFTGANVIQKLICPQLNFWSLFLIRSLTQMIIMAIHILMTKGQFFGPKEARRKIFAQGSLGGLLLLAIFVAVEHIPLGNASAIFFCTPVATFIFATCMLKEPLKLYRFMIIALMLTGVALITRPSWMGFPKDQDYGKVDKNITLGYLCAMAVPICSAIVSIWTRQCRKVQTSIVMFWFAVGSTFWAFIGIAAFGQFGKIFNLNLEEIGWTFGIVAAGMLGNFSYTVAVKWVSPTKANVFRSFEVILNYLLQICFEHVVFHPTDICGIISLLLAVVATGYEAEVIKKKLHRWL